MLQARKLESRSLLSIPAAKSTCRAPSERETEREGERERERVHVSPSHQKPVVLSLVPEATG